LSGSYGGLPQNLLSDSVLHSYPRTKPVSFLPPMAKWLFFSKVLGHYLAIHPSFWANSIRDTRHGILDSSDKISTGGLEDNEAGHDDGGSSTGKSDERVTPIPPLKTSAYLNRRHQ
jgi:hypothetical protein